MEWRLDIVVARNRYSCLFVNCVEDTDPDGGGAVCVEDKQSWRDLRLASAADGHFSIFPQTDVPILPASYFHSPSWTPVTLLIRQMSQCPGPAWSCFVNRSPGFNFN